MNHLKSGQTKGQIQGQLRKGRSISNQTGQQPKQLFPPIDQKKKVAPDKDQKDQKKKLVICKINFPSIIINKPQKKPMSPMDKLASYKRTISQQRQQLYNLKQIIEVKNKELQQYEYRLNQLKQISALPTNPATNEQQTNTLESEEKSFLGSVKTDLSFYIINRRSSSKSSKSNENFTLIQEHKPNELTFSQETINFKDNN